MTAITIRGCVVMTHPLIIFDYVTESKMKVFLYVPEEWGRFLVDRVGVSPFGHA